MKTALPRMLSSVPRALCVASVAALGAPAFASPQVETASDHEVTGRVVVAADAATLRKLVSDPVKVAAIDVNGAQIEVEDEGQCKLVRTFIAHPIASIRYRARQCPKGEGYRTELVESGDLEAFHSEWAMRAVQGGTELIYKVRTIPRIAVPQFIVDRQTRSSVEKLLTRVKEAAERGG